MTRLPAVAGQFYPDQSDKVLAELDRYLPSGANRRAVKAIVVPHAGWMYSGATAGLAYSRVAVPERVILVGPNHRDVGKTYAVFDSGAWRTPVSSVPVAASLAAELLAHCDLLDTDSSAHAREHSLEVQIPMLFHANPHVQILPLLIGGGWPEAGGRLELRRIGEAIADVAGKSEQPVLLIASTDLNHYEDREISRLKDQDALEAVLALDEDGLMERVKTRKISMCGVAATYVVLVAAKRLGAHRAELIDYRTSGDVTGDFSSVVGYGAVLIE